MSDHTSAPHSELQRAVARLFYIEQHSKTEIAHQLGISRFRVARMLQEALESGLVSISIQDEPSFDLELGREIESRFGIRLCTVVRVGPDASAIDAVASVAARQMEEMVEAEDVVGVAWGRTVSAVVGAIDANAFSAAEIVQLAGGSIAGSLGPGSDEIGRVLASSAGCAYRPLHAPAILATSALRDELMREPSIASTIERYDDIAFALVGIGNLDSADSAMAFQSQLKSAHAATLPPDVVGELVLHLFDRSGTFANGALEARIAGISIEQLRAIPRVLGVAAGAAKADAIAGALRTGAVSFLVIDDQAAIALLAS